MARQDGEEDLPAQPPADTIAGAEIEAAADGDSGPDEGKIQGSTLPPIATGASVPPEVQIDANGGKAEGGTVEDRSSSKEVNALDVTLPPISSAAADPQPRPAEERMVLAEAEAEAEVEISPAAGSVQKEPQRRSSAPRAAASSTKQAREDARRRILAAREELQRRVAEATEARLKRQAEAEAHARERAEQAQKMAQKRLAQRKKKSESATPDSKRGEASTETSTSSPGRSSSPGKNVPQDLPGLKPAKARVKRKIQKARDAQEARLKEIEEDRRRSQQRQQAQAEAAEVLRAQAARRAGERMRRERQAEANARAQRDHDLQQARERQQLYRSPKKIAELIAAAEASVAHSNVEERKHAARHTESYLQKERQRARRRLDGEGDDRPFGEALRKPDGEVRRGEPEDEDALTPQHVRRSSAKSSSSSLWRDRSAAAKKKKKRKAKKAARDQGKHKKDWAAKKEKSVDMGFEAALAAAAKERAAAATSTGGTDRNEKVKPKEGFGKKLRPATQGHDSTKAPLLSSSKCEVVDAFSYDPTKKPDADYSKPDPLSVANSGLDIQRRIYEHDRGEYNADQLRRCDAIARGTRPRTFLMVASSPLTESELCQMWPKCQRHFKIAQAVCEDSPRVNRRGLEGEHQVLLTPLLVMARGVGHCR
eukprot:s1098_g12.t3